MLLRRKVAFERTEQTNDQEQCPYDNVKAMESCRHEEC